MGHVGRKELFPEFGRIQFQFEAHWYGGSHDLFQVATVLNERAVTCLQVDLVLYKCAITYWGYRGTVVKALNSKINKAGFKPDRCHLSAESLSMQDSLPTFFFT